MNSPSSSPNPRPSALLRELDPRYPTNLAIMLLTPISGVVTGLLTLLNGDTLAQAVGAGFFSGAAAFIAWILGRELDPDHEYSAFIGVALAFTASLFVDWPNLFALTAVILGTRIVNRIVGQSATLLDSLIVLILALIVIFSGHWTFGLAAAAAFLFDARLNQPHRAHGLAAGITLTATITALAHTGTGELGTFTTPYLISVSIIGAAFGWHILTTHTVTTLCDATRQPLDLSRERATMGFGLLAAVVFLWEGDAGIAAMMPLWAAMLGTVIYRIASPFMSR